MLRAEPVEELLRVRTSRLREQNLAAKLWQQLAELLGVSRLVEEVSAEDEIPRGRAKERLRFAPTNPSHAKEDAVQLRVPPQQLYRVLCPVRCEDLGPAQSCRERRQTQAAPQLDDSQSAQLAGSHVAGESKSARPELGPVRQELLLVERRLVDQLLRARRTQDRQPQAGAELDILFD